MSTTQPTVRFGLVFVAMGIAAGVMMHLHPEKLHAPAWVAYTSAAVFCLAGLSIIAQALGMRGVNRWLACVLLGVMTLIPGWIGFVGGPRQCSAFAPGARSAASGAGCRLPFGLAAVLCAMIFLVALRRALRPSPAA